MAELKAQQAAPEEGEKKAAVRLPKPTLQKLGPEDDIEFFIATFERVAKQQEWPAEIWPIQLAGLLTGKAMAAYASLSSESAADYEEVKKAVLRRYDVHEEAHRRRFRTDRKRPEESYTNWGDRLTDHFARWTKDSKMSLAELMVLDQFLAAVPEDLRVWLKEQRPESLRKAMGLADDYALARGSGGAMSRRPPAVDSPVPPPGGNRREGGRMILGHQPRDTPMSERSQTNARGEKRCFQCGRYGHLMYNCPKRPVGASKPALFAQAHHRTTQNHGGYGHCQHEGGDDADVKRIIDPG